MKISIVMPIFNGEDFVDAAVDCAQSQTHQDFELIMINDGSSDSTSEKIRARSARDPRIVLIDLAKNGGPAAARNVGLEAASGEWIAIIDADDICDPRRLELLLDYAQTKQLDFVADNQVLFDRNAGQTVRKGFEVRPHQHDIKLDLNLLFIYDRPNLPFALGLLKPLIRAEFIRTRGLRYQASLRNNEDFDFYTRCLANGARAGLMSAALYQYTMPFGAISRLPSQDNRSQNQLNTCLHVAERLEADIGNNLSAPERHAFKTRYRALKAEMQFEEIKASKGLRRYLRLCLFLIKEPGYIQRVLKFLTKSHSESTVIVSYETM